jgi:DNA-binding Xre family transcriptional regulator
MLKVIKLKLAKLLKEKGHGKKSYRDLSKEVGVDHVSLWKMIHGKPYNPSLDCLDKLCKFLDCRPEELLEYRKG